MVTVLLVRELPIFLKKTEKIKAARKGCFFFNIYYMKKEIG